MDKEHSKVTIASDVAKEEKTMQYLVLSASREAAVIYFHLNGNPEELTITDEDSHVALIYSNNLTIDVIIFDKS